MPQTGKGDRYGHRRYSDSCAPTLDNEQREQVEKALLEQQGVVMAHFSPGQPHTLVVAFDPATVQSGPLLQIVREWDQAATLVGL